jgi:hypothetical protein
MKIILRMCAVALAMTMSGAAFASPIVFMATLSHAGEAAPDSGGTGSAVVTIDQVANTMEVMVTFADLNGNTTASHIHCCTVVAGTGNAGVATITPTFTGFPGGVKSGTYDHVFDMTAPAGSFNPAFVTANGGSISTAWDVLLTGIAAGKAYLNIHTSTNPGGEIRGFLVPAPVPLPAALTLFVSALGGFGFLRRKRA